LGRAPRHEKKHDGPHPPGQAAANNRQERFLEGAMHNDFYHLFEGYWWLLFPLGWAIAVGVRAWLRHLQAKAKLALIKSYIDQGKEPPPELLHFLQEPARAPKPPQDFSQHYILVGFIFAGLAVAFAVMCAMKFTANDLNANAGLVFVAVLMTGFSIAFFVTGRIAARSKNRLPPS
jgi:hypothetical protein